MHPPTHAFADAPSPCFVLDEAKLRQNLEVLANVANESGATIICALKGFAFRRSFPLVREYLPGVTASSLAEARLGAEEFRGSVHAYCPAYIDADFDAIAARASHVTFNSRSEFERYRSRLAGKSAGLRINPEYAEVETDLYNPCVPGSRLGVTASQLGTKLPEGIEGLHFHTLCENGADTLSRTLEHVRSRFDTQLSQARWLNMGGGHAITREGYDRQQLIREVRQLEERYPNLQEIILEPGSAVGWQTGVLVSTVLDIVTNERVSTAMLDTSFAAHMPDCLEMPYRPEVRGADSHGQGRHRYHLGGQTCLAGDVMPDYSFERPLAVGDRIVFEDMIHYTMVKTTTFNGVRLPAIGVVRENGRFEVLREFGFEDYASRL